MTRDELMKAYGDNVFACLADDDAAAAPHEITQAYVSGRQYTSTCKLRRKDGSLFWVMLFGRFVHDENARLFLNAYFTDITFTSAPLYRNTEIMLSDTVLSDL